MVDLALGASLATHEELHTCIEHQHAHPENGRAPSLTRLLLDRGYMTREEVSHLWELYTQHVWGKSLCIPGYEILESIGEGAMGMVFLARQMSMDREVAVKVLSPECARDAEYIKRFLLEARASAQLRHDTLAGGIDVGVIDGLYYLVMEYFHGEPLSSVLERENRLPEAECLQIVTQIARGLVHVHDQGIVHRDIKPENIIITSGGRARLCDLGLAKHEPLDPNLTRDGHTVGTPHTISPEQACGEPDIDRRTDIYSLGAMLYRMSTGEYPFTGEDALEIMTRHVNDPLTPPRELNPELSEPFNSLVMSMLAKRREDRPAWARALLDEIDAVRAETAPTEKLSLAWVKKQLGQL